MTTNFTQILNQDYKSDPTVQSKIQLWSDQKASGRKLKEIGEEAQTFFSSLPRYAGVKLKFYDAAIGRFMTSKGLNNQRIQKSHDKPKTKKTRSNEYALAVEAGRKVGAKRIKIVQTSKGLQVEYDLA